MNWHGYYIYVCYPLLKVDHDHPYCIMASVNMSEMESFSTSQKAVDFMKERYAEYIMTVEKCDEEIYRSIQQGEKV